MIKNRAKLTPQDAHSLLAAIQYDRYARECLGSDDMEGYETWSRMRDEHLVRLTGLDTRGLVELAKSLSAAA